MTTPMTVEVALPLHRDRNYDDKHQRMRSVEGESPLLAETLRHFVVRPQDSCNSRVPKGG